MSDATSGELQRLIAAEFETLGWDYDMNVGRGLVGEMVRRGSVDPAALAKRVPATWLERNRANRDEVAAAIERAVGGRIPVPEAGAVTLVANDNRSYSVTVEAGGRIDTSNINLGGTQINIQSGASADELLDAVAALVRAGLSGDWNADAATALARAINDRNDVTIEDVEEVTAEVVRAAQPRRGRVRELLTSIAAQGLGGALGTGIAAGAGAILPHLPI